MPTKGASIYSFLSNNLAITEGGRRALINTNWFFLAVSNPFQKQL